MENQNGHKLMEKHNSFNRMEKPKGFKSPRMEKQVSFHHELEKRQSVRRLMENQKSFRIIAEKQVSFGGSSQGKRVKDSPGKRGDFALHLAARGGNLAKVRDIFKHCERGKEAQLITQQNQQGETSLYAAAENGHVLVVKEFLKHLDIQSASIAATNGYDPFHIAAKEGHIEVLTEFLACLPSLAMTANTQNATALDTAASQGHTDVVNLLLETDSNLSKIARNNGKTALHSAARKGHLEIVKSLLAKDPSLGFRTDLKGQTATHMAAKGHSVGIMLELLKPDPSVLAVEDNKGNTALHYASRKNCPQIVQCLLLVEGININVVNKSGETPLDIAEKNGIANVVSMLKQAGAMNGKDVARSPTTPAKQLKQTVSDIKHDVQSQLKQTRKTGVRVHKIAKGVKKLHASGLNNAINSATVVAVLIATVAFAAIFQVPGQYVDKPANKVSIGEAHIAKDPAFLIFVVFDSISLFISLAVVVVQTSIVVVQNKAKRQLVFVINKLMWVACLSISVAFVSLTYVVVGSHGRWLAIVTTVMGSLIMISTIGALSYCVILHRINRSKSRSIKRTETGPHSSVISYGSDPESLDATYTRVYAV
uniref:PGG domain-containing protein n=1 Tax=Kalanchoe fedtschenkoi TaxID=63787 RepID=A0A7N0TVI2_KALFE